MGIDAEELILNPFHEVVERGKEAVANAERAADQDAELSQVMGKAGVAVVKEGERALKRLQPLWDSQVDKYGDAFKESMGQDAAIEKRRRKLEHLLYDFEDYAEPDTFVHERFAELQAATKSLAMDVIDVIKKLKLDTAITPPYSPPSPSKFPPLPPLPPLPLKSPSRIVNGARSPRPPTPPGRKGGRTGALGSPPPLPPGASSPDRIAQSTPVPPPDLSEATLPAPRTRLPPGKRDLVGLNTGSQRSLKSNSTVHSRASSAYSVGSLPPPAYTPDSEAPPVPQITHYNTADRPESRESSSLGIHGPPTPQNSTLSRQPSLSATDASSISEIPDFPVPQPHTGIRTTAWVSDQAGSPNPRYHGHRPPSRYEPHSLQAIQSLQQTAIPEDQAVAAGSSSSMPVPRARAGHSFINFDTALTPIISELSRFGVDPSSSPGGGSGPDSPETSRSTTLSHATSMSSLRTGSTHIMRPGTSNGGWTPITPADTTHQPPKGSFSPISLPPAALEPPEGHHTRLPEAAVPVPLPTPAHPAPEDWATRTVLSISDHASTTNFSATSPTTTPQPREPDTAIGQRSSLHLLGGFCPGAQAFRASGHGDGVRRVAGHVAGHSAATARCEACSYGHAWSELELDVRERMPRATFPRGGGLLFRIRLLYKSHLGAPRPGEAFYGCLFCAQSGRVVREGDATVFRGADELLRHVASHPQPLPDVPGLTVLYGREVLAADPRVNDFDVWLTEPPQRGGVPPEVEAEVARLPVATAVKGHVQRYGEKKLPRPDGKGPDSLLQFFEGSRVIGVEFPGKYAGKWCTGWHDGVWGYFPAKIVELEKPMPGRLDAPPLPHGVGGSGVTAVAKWKWDPGAAAREGWLGFDKGEKLVNVGWPAEAGKEAWCWSGSTSKGKFGVFPRSHIDESSLREDANSQAPGGGGGKSKRKEGGRSGGKFFGVRRRHSTTSSMSGGSGVIEII
ncbi:hypothetical protein KVR01_007643 [Diaporthe batatas]|uniref:uncharacterized protein n=1 Tax=Diaporthe batatas TaxID=748121 RepID=UPI001D03BB4D|nr:uncharacterized protein KVR01_007643 [Diaporthe batatas]KAG8163165.1 hypothetical protein KVR01_007643 [Diaporthe batatas]